MRLDSADDRYAHVEEWLRRSVNDLYECEMAWLGGPKRCGPLVDPLPTPRWLSPRARVAREFMLIADQCRVRSFCGLDTSVSVTGALGDLGLEYEVLSR